MAVRTAAVHEDEAWLQAAKEFTMNDDFDISSQLSALAGEGSALSLPEVMQVMKDESKSKQTIQALGDKILLRKMLENLNVPQMPSLFATHGKVEQEEVEQLVGSLMSSYEGGNKDAFEIVIKPTHLSNCAGALILSKEIWDACGWNAEKLLEHMQTHLAMQADDCESQALKSLVPGYTVQPRYRSIVDFNIPLELRVVTLWGKARVGIWWWGRPAAPNTVCGYPFPQRTVWLSRRQTVPGTLSKHDSWEVLHHHEGYNPGFHAALKIFQEAMPAMAATAEVIAKATGAPFLRSDFFVGSKEWGVRLNEVAYGSGCDMKRRDMAGQVVDDSPAIARILQEGVKVAACEPPQYFLQPLGVKGSAYEVPPWQFWHKDSPGLEVTALDGEQRPGLPLEATLGFSKASEINMQPIGSELCQTMKMKARARSPGPMSSPQPRLRSPQPSPRQSASLNPRIKVSAPANIVVRQVNYNAIKVPSRSVMRQRAQSPVGNQLIKQHKRAALSPCTALGALGA
mmetsp:Transcript_52717/g.92539  ORF Transcript_52717/g.92539 Transcript_52717/m.92539 type:complete len:513 (-) Transcript_52717:15-1553(-)